MLTAKLILERFNKDHRLLERRERLSRSFALGFLQLLYVAHAQIKEGAPYTMNDITNAPHTVDSDAGTYNQSHCSKATLRLGAPPGLSGVFCADGDEGATGGGPLYPYRKTIEGHNMGIVVGTGVGAVAPTDIALGTKIAHGRAGGQLEYGGSELVGLIFADPNGQFTMRRYFTNNSGGGITVQEAGIYSVGTYRNGHYAWSFCIARDITGAVPVADTEILRASYVVQITV